MNCKNCNFLLDLSDRLTALFTKKYCSIDCYLESDEYPESDYYLNNGGFI